MRGPLVAPDCLGNLQPVEPGDVDWKTPLGRAASLNSARA